MGLTMKQESRSVKADYSNDCRLFFGIEAALLLEISRRLSTHL
jgi:hypothetical protein